MATNTQKVETPSNLNPSQRKFKARDRAKMKDAVERFRAYAGTKITRAQISALAYFTFPITKEETK